MKNKLWFYLGFFAILVTGFFYFVFQDYDFKRSKLAVINPAVPEFRFVNQDSNFISQKETDDKVYVAEYFFTTCKGICPKMNANMRRVFNEYKNEKDFMILSHTCMPEVDSISVLKKYEQKMLAGKLFKNDDGSYTLKDQGQPAMPNTNWHFLTGDKTQLYKLARQGYMIDNSNPDSLQNVEDQFLHTQFFALVDRHRRVRGIYDGLHEDEVMKLMGDIKELLNESVSTKRFMNGFSNNPQ